MKHLLLALFLAPTPTARVIVYRADLAPVAGGYPAITDGPVLCGNRLLTRGDDYWIFGDTMRVDCPPTERVSTFLAVWVESPVGRRRP